MTANDLRKPACDLVHPGFMHSRLVRILALHHASDALQCERGIAKLLEEERTVVLRAISSQELAERDMLQAQVHKLSKELAARDERWMSLLTHHFTAVLIKHGDDIETTVKEFAESEHAEIGAEIRKLTEERDGLREQAHYADGVAELAMRERDGLRRHLETLQEMTGSECAVLRAEIRKLTEERDALRRQLASASRVFAAEIHDVTVDSRKSFEEVFRDVENVDDAIHARLATLEARYEGAPQEECGHPRNERYVGSDREFCWRCHSIDFTDRLAAAEQPCAECGGTIPVCQQCVAYKLHGLEERVIAAEQERNTLFKENVDLSGQIAAAEKLAETVRKLAIIEGCGCSHDDENCCTKVGEPCASCALAAFEEANK